MSYRNRNLNVADYFLIECLELLKTCVYVYSTQSLKTSRGEPHCKIYIKLVYQKCKILLLQSSSDIYNFNSSFRMPTTVTMTDVSQKMPATCTSVATPVFLHVAKSPLEAAETSYLLHYRQGENPYLRCLRSDFEELPPPVWVLDWVNPVTLGVQAITLCLAGVLRLLLARWAVREWVACTKILVEILLMIEGKNWSSF